MTDLMSPTTSEITKALVSAAENFRPAVKDSENPHFRSKFVSLAGVNDAVDAALLANGLFLSQQTDVIDGANVIVSLLLHTSGEWLRGIYKLTPVKQNDPQAEGSAMTYGRRYAKMALLGVAPEDDDGNAASAPAHHPATRRASPAKAPPAQVNPVEAVRKVALAAGYDNDMLALDVASRHDGQILDELPESALREEYRVFSGLAKEQLK